MAIKRIVVRESLEYLCRKYIETKGRRKEIKVSSSNICRLKLKNELPSKVIITTLSSKDTYLGSNLGRIAWIQTHCFSKCSALGVE